MLKTLTSLVQSYKIQSDLDYLFQLFKPCSLMNCLAKTFLFKQLFWDKPTFQTKVVWKSFFFLLFCRMTSRCRKVLSKSLHLRCGLSYSYFTYSNFWSPSSSWPSTTSWDKMFSRFNFCKVDDSLSCCTLSNSHKSLGKFGELSI